MRTQWKAQQETQRAPKRMTRAQQEAAYKAQQEARWIDAVTAPH